jgi:cyanophycinase
LSERRGTIVAIGGAEDRKADRVILRRFVNLCGGSDARIAVIPTASRRRSTGREYARIFQDLRVRSVEVLRIRGRSERERGEILSSLSKATGLFMTGGAQLNLATIIGGTPVAEAIRRRNQNGMHVAGTSAGAAFLSTRMIGLGNDGHTPRAGMVSISPGLGLLPGIIIDQHFSQRNRLGRLITALSLNPELLGVGLDEDTAAFLDGEDKLTVTGSGGVTVVDPSGTEYTSGDTDKKDHPISAIGLQMHVLIDGGTYDLVTRRASPGVAITARG